MAQKAAAQAQARRESGQVWGQAVANIGQGVGQRVRQVTSPTPEQKRQQQLSTIMQRHQGDMDSAIEEISAVDPEYGLKLRESKTKADQAAFSLADSQWKSQKEKIDFLHNQLGAAQNEDDWEEAKYVLNKAGIKTDTIPPFSTKTRDHFNQLMLSAKERLEMSKPKPPQDYTLTPGAKRFDANNKEVASVPSNPPAEPKPPAVGSFEDFVTRKYGEKPTPEQVLQARKDYMQSDDKAAGAQAADVTVLTPSGLDMAALNYRKTGTMPPLGMGDRTTRQRIINRAAELKAEDIARIEAGGTDLAGNRADYKADSTSLAGLTKQRDAIGAFEQTAKKNIDLFLEAAKKVPDTGIPLLNTPARWASGAGGSADVAKYNAARQVAISEIAKIVQNPNLTGQLSDSARHEIEVFNPKNATLAQTVAVMNLLKQDMQNRAKSLEDQITNTRGRIGGGATAASPQPTGRFNPQTGKVEPIQ